MRLKIDGGSTNYEGIYPVSKSSSLSVEKSKVSPTMMGINILIDIRRGGVIDRGGSLAWWMIDSVTPKIFKSGAWFSVSEDYLNKYYPYWEKFGLTGKFRQAQIYELARTDENFVNFLQLIWLDLISLNYELQRDVCKAMRDTIEATLTVNLGIEPIPESAENNESDTAIDLDALDEIVGSDSE